MTDLRYPFAALRGDYVRAGLGVTLALAPALAIPLASPINYLLLPAAALFLAFGARTWQRQQSRVVIDRQGISLFRAGQVSLPWRSVRAVRLSYFSTRADRREGWMQLTLTGEDPERNRALRKVRIDSSLDGFEQVARCAAAAVRMNDLAVSATTRANFDALGIDIANGAVDPTAEMAHAAAAAQETR
ncbi:MAG: hypothetical protein JO128_21800 [Alphaproteobacteria bacterium]|nr:hypothetical protein [Alphaproteobacteria bacterium]